MAVQLRKVVSFFVLNQVFNSNLLTGKNIAGRTFRFNSSFAMLAKKLTINEYGDPNKVVYLEEETLVLPKTDQVKDNVQLLHT